MREIKFRAWDEGLNKFHFPKLWDKSMPSNWEKWYVLQQYTGLKDKNGKEIYSGDLIKSGKTGLNYKVVWDDENAAWESLCTNPERDYCLMPYSWCDGEIIGNIHEHKHLLEAE